MNSHCSQVKNKRKLRPKTYFQLVQKVGSYGKYQHSLMHIFIFVWVLAGITYMNIQFLFYNKNFQCQKFGFLTYQCKKQVCQLSQKQRKKYINDEEIKIKSLAHEFGSYHCKDEIYIEIGKSSFYLGSFIGLLIFSYFSDNYGRKKLFLISLSVWNFGNLLLSFTFNLQLTIISLFIIGFGISFSIVSTIFFLGQNFQNTKRQKYYFLFQICFILGSIGLIITYALIPYWRMVSIIFVTVPSLIVLLLVFLHVEQAPQYLLNGPDREAVNVLNKIGKRNCKIQDLIQEEDILSVKQFNVITKEFIQIKIKHLDLLKLPSLRQLTICFWINSFIFVIIYNFLDNVIKEIQLDIFENTLMLQVLSLISCVPLFIYIQKIKRKSTCQILLFIIFLCFTLLIFFQLPQNNRIKSQNLISLVLVIILRISLILYLSIFYIHLYESYPLNISALALGTAVALGNLASLINQLIISLQTQQKYMIILCSLFGILGFQLTQLLNQTKYKDLRTQIQQIQMLKETEKSMVLNRSSFGRLSILKSSLKR